MKILCELLSVINTLHVHLNIEDAEEMKNVNIERDLILIGKSNKTSYTRINLCRGIYLKPNSLSEVTYDRDWLSFRVHLEAKSRVINSVLEELARDISSFNFDAKKESDLVNLPIQLKCKCGHFLTDIRTFTKMCPLPSVDWDSASENWFCHLHHDDKDAMKSHNLTPKETECFYNELFVCLNSKVFPSLKITGAIVSCEGCSSEIGMQKGSCFRLWTNDIKWATQDEIVFSRSSSDILLSLFHNIEKDSLGANSRIALELNGSIKQFIYIVTMDSHLNLLVTQNSSLYNGTSSSESPTSPKKQRLEEQGNCFLKKLKSVKLLYKHKLKEDDESGAWVDDVNVNILPCGRSFFSSIFKLLENSNDCLPQNVRTVEDMKVGYIVK